MQTYQVTAKLNGQVDEMRELEADSKEQALDKFHDQTTGFWTQEEWDSDKLEFTIKETN